MLTHFVRHLLINPPLLASVSDEAVVDNLVSVGYFIRRWL